MIGPGGTCTKTGCPVREVLKDNNPSLQEKDSTDTINSTFEFYEEVLDAVHLDIYGSYVEVVARHLGSSDGLVEAEAKFLKC